MAKRISLHEFQAGLARRLADTRDNRALALLAVQAGQRNWLVDLTEAGEILAVPPLATVPLAEPWFRGLASVRGNLFGVVDFAAFHGDPSIAPAGQARLLLVGVRHELNCAILVSRALGLRSLDDFEVVGVVLRGLWPPGAGAIRMVVVLGQRGQPLADDLNVHQALLRRN